MIYYKKAKMYFMSSSKDRYTISVAVFVILKNMQNEILLLKRATTGWMDNHFSLPAGRLENGEELHIAAAREAYEEVGVTIDPKHLHLQHTLHSNTHGNTWIGFFFETSTWEGTPEVREPHKHSEIRWTSIDTLPKNTIPYVSQALLSKESYLTFGWEVIK